jgi:hypothetical protein
MNIFTVWNVPQTNRKYLAVKTSTHKRADKVQNRGGLYYTIHSGSIQKLTKQSKLYFQTSRVHHRFYSRSGSLLVLHEFTNGCRLGRHLPLAPRHIYTRGTNHAFNHTIIRKQLALSDFPHILLLPNGWNLEQSKLRVVESRVHSFTFVLWGILHTYQDRSG